MRKSGRFPRRAFALSQADRGAKANWALCPHFAWILFYSVRFLLAKSGGVETLIFIVFGASRSGDGDGLFLACNVIDMDDGPANPSRDTHCDSLFVNLARIPHNYLWLALIRTNLSTDADVFVEISVFRVPEFLAIIRPYDYSEVFVGVGFPKI